MEKKTLTFDILPKSVDDIKKLGDLSSPFETAALTVLALNEYPNNKDASIDMLNYLKGPRALTNHEIQFLRDRFNSSDYTVRSYFVGTSPENDYSIQTPFAITVEDNPYSYVEEGYVKLFIKSSGADTPRSVLLRRKGEQWLLWDQFLLSGVRPPKSMDEWA